MREAKSNATVGSGPGESFLGSDMRAAYYGTGSLNGAGQTLGLFELEGTDLADLNTYYKNVNQTLNVPITLFSVDGAKTSCVSPCDDTEQTLDMTQALGMAPKSRQPRHVHRQHRNSDFQCHGDSQPAERAAELLVVLEVRPIPRPSIRSSRSSPPRVRTCSTQPAMITTGRRAAPSGLPTMPTSSRSVELIGHPERGRSMEVGKRMVPGRRRHLAEQNPDSVLAGHHG